MSNRLQDPADRASLDGKARFFPLTDRQANSTDASNILVSASARIGEQTSPFENMTSRSDSLDEYVLGAGSSPGRQIVSSKGPRDAARVAKRMFDIAFSVIMLFAFAPLMALLCFAVRVSSPGPAIFVQQRIGRDGIMFPCLKFRTMVVDASEQLERLLRTDPVARAEWERDQKLRNDVRITPVGRFLRRTSFDELPQLLNIVVGHMSVVGPRPIVALEATRYGVFFKDYCAVRPGLTGLWQIGGRNDVSYDSRVKLDVQYVRTRSLAGDIAICCKTVPALLQARGCY